MQPIIQAHGVSYTAYHIHFILDYHQELSDNFRSLTTYLTYNTTTKKFVINHPQSECDYDLLLMAQDLIKELMVEVFGVEREERIEFVNNFPNKFPNFKN